MSQIQPSQPMQSYSTIPSATPVEAQLAATARVLQEAAKAKADDVRQAVESLQDAASWFSQLSGHRRLHDAYTHTNAYTHTQTTGCPDAAWLAGVCWVGWSATDLACHKFVGRRLVWLIGIMDDVVFVFCCFDRLPRRCLDCQCVLGRLASHRFGPPEICWPAACVVDWFIGGSSDAA